MESQRQKKISALIQKDISTIIQDFFRNKTRANLIISVTKVNVSPDLSISKIYLSVFPSANFSKVIDVLNKSKSEIRKKTFVSFKTSAKGYARHTFFLLMIL